jgi:hypothetical protein
VPFKRGDKVRVKRAGDGVHIIESATKAFYGMSDYGYWLTNSLKKKEQNYVIGAFHEEELELISVIERLARET